MEPLNQNYDDDNEEEEEEDEEDDDDDDDEKENRNYLNQNNKIDEVPSYTEYEDSLNLMNDLK